MTKTIRVWMLSMLSVHKTTAEIYIERCWQEYPRKLRVSGIFLYTASIDMKFDETYYCNIVAI